MTVVRPLPSVAATVRERLKAAGVPFLANDNIADHVTREELDAIQREVEAAARAMLDALVIDHAADHNTRDTPRRIAKMFVREVFKGRYEPRPAVTDFPNVRAVDEIAVVGPITVRSTCSHHFAPIMGKAWIGVIPSDRVIGLSKFARLTDWVMSRPQIQEEAAVALADEIEAAINPRGLAVVIKASHLCMTWRGVREPGAEMTSSVMRGIFRSDQAARAEFMTIIRGQGFDH